MTGRTVMLTGSPTATLVEDMAALAYPHRLAERLDPRWVTRAHHLLISKEIAAAVNGQSNLIITTPPQIGKSTICAEWAPQWILSCDPSRKVMIGSYGQRLATRSGRRVRNRLAEFGRRFGVELAPGTKSADEWYTTREGGVKAVGLGSGATGFPADCIPGDVHLLTRMGSVPIGEFVASGCPSDVLSYNHETGLTEWRPVEAARVIEERPIVEITTRNGHTFRCTPDHRVYVLGHGYTAARDLTPGDPLLALQSSVSAVTRPQEVLFSSMREPAQAAQELRDVQRGVRAGEQDSEVLLCRVLVGTRTGPPRMPAVRGQVLGSPLPGNQEGEATRVLLPSVLERVQGHHGSLRGMREEDHPQGGTEVLLNRVPRPSFNGDTDVPGLLGEVLPEEMRLREIRPQRSAGVLLDAVPGPVVIDPVLGNRDPVHRTMPDVRDNDRRPGPDVLLQGMPTSARGGEEASREGMHRVRDNLPAQVEPHGVLLTYMREPGPLPAHGRGEQLPLQARDVVQRMVRRHEASDQRARRAQVRGVQGSGVVHQRVPARPGKLLPAEHVPRSSPRREPEEQRSGKLDPSVQYLPRQAPQVSEDAVSMVRHVRGPGERVYDIQVEGNRNFFAGEVLVHNCLIVDDYCKSRADADSPVMRDNVWEWYSSGLLSRMSPDACKMVLATRWHPDDLIGRLLKEQGRVEEGGLWKLIHLPAVAELELTGGTDPLGRNEGDPLTHPKLSTQEELSAYWAARKAETPIVRDWRALYMGDPMERTGALVSWDIIQAATVPWSEVPEAHRVVVAVDPSGGGADEAGIIVARLGSDERVYITHDASAVMPVTEWPRVACDMAEEHGADRIVLETNFGGKLVEQAIRAAWISKTRDELMPSISNVRALRGKVIRAEPIAQEMAMGRVKFSTGLDKLARQWASYRAGDPDSPGRLDASVYACVALLRSPVEDLMREERRTRRLDGVQGRGRRLPGR